MLSRTSFATVVGVIVSAAVMSMPLASLANDQLPWAADYAAACQQANAQGKLVLLHFYSDDCPPCVRVERNVFSQASVAEAVGSCCVPVKVHVRKSPDLASKYRVQQWPTDVFVMPDGREITRSVSPQSPAAYINMTTSIASAAGIQAVKQQAQNVAAAQPSQAGQLAPWMTAPARDMVTQATAQSDAVAPWMAQGAADAKQQFQASAQQTTQQFQQNAQQFQQAAQQYQQGAQQQAQQAWQTAQFQANQAANGVAQTAHQATQGAQQTTQAAADAAKEIINKYAQPTLPPPGGMPWQGPTPEATAAANGAAPPWANAAGSPAANHSQTLAPAPTSAAAMPDANPALAAAQAAPAGGYPIAMSGYCPVTLATDKKWKKGQPQFGVVHRRRTFLFASEVEQKKFLLEPDKFSPVMTGYDPVKFMQTGELVDGNAAYSLTYRKQVYLFTDDASLKSFWQNPAQFTEGLRQAMTQQERNTQLR